MRWAVRLDRRIALSPRWTLSGAMFAFANLVLFALLAAPASAEANRSAMAELERTDLRVATIGQRLLIASSTRCSNRMPATGMVLHSLPQYGPAGRSEALAQWNFPSVVSIEAVVPNSAAASADIRPGDGLVAIAGQRLPLAAARDAPVSILRDQAEDRLATLSPGLPIRLTINRDGQEISVELLAPVACRSRVELVAGNSVYARSDGKVIQLGQQFASQLDDEGLAVAFAHELAHTILEHRAQLDRLERAVARRKATARRFEDEADLFSLHLLAGAGWDPAIAPRFMRQQGRHFDPLFPGFGKHRSAEDRARRMEQEIAGMKAPLAIPEQTRP